MSCMVCGLYLNRAYVLKNNSKNLKKSWHAWRKEKLFENLRGTNNRNRLENGNTVIIVVGQILIRDSSNKIISLGKCWIN